MKRKRPSKKEMVEMISFQIRCNKRLVKTYLRSRREARAKYFSECKAHGYTTTACRYRTDGWRDRDIVKRYIDEIRFCQKLLGEGK